MTKFGDLTTFLPINRSFQHIHKGGNFAHLERTQKTLTLKTHLFQTSRSPPLGQKQKVTAPWLWFFSPKPSTSFLHPHTRLATTHFPFPAGHNTAPHQTFPPMANTDRDQLLHLPFSASSPQASPFLHTAETINPTAVPIFRPAKAAPHFSPSPSPASLTRPESDPLATARTQRRVPSSS